MAGLRGEVLLVFLTGSLLLSGALGWEWIQEDRVRGLYPTGQTGDEDIGDDQDYDNYDDSVDDATNDDLDPHEVQVDADSDPSDWSSVAENSFQEETDSDPSDWSSINEGGFHVETIVGPRDWSRVPDNRFPGELDAGVEDWSSNNEEEFQVETDSGPRDWSRVPGDRFQEELDSGPVDWSSDLDGDDSFEVETASGPSDPSSDDDDDDFSEEVVSGPRGWADDDGDSMEFIDSPPTSWPGITSPDSTGLDVVCSEAGFHITLSEGSLNDLKVLGSKNVMPVLDATENCSYDVNLRQNSFTVPFTGCNVKQQTAAYSLELLYNDDLGQMKVVTTSCEINSGLVPRASPTVPPKCPTKCTKKPQNCNIPSGERVRCGHKGISASLCKKKGCCSAYSACFYPLDECTADKYFVFAIRHNSAHIPVDPTKLVIPRYPKCKPVIVNSKVAIYKFKVTECGARAYNTLYVNHDFFGHGRDSVIRVVGKTQIYLAEVQTVIRALNLKYGIITRDDPLRFLIECRYGKSGSQGGASLSSVGYMVKVPTRAESIWPSSLSAPGLYTVQLRLAKDRAYSKYHPTYHQPLHVLLKKPLYLELNLRSPKPDAVLLVNYCLAFPRNARNALVLIYQGCANPYDKSVAILYIRDPPNNRHQRRFMVKAFQFMDVKKKSFLNEEIYFMCSTEVCRPLEKKCRQRCFDKP